MKRIGMVVMIFILGAFVFAGGGQQSGGSTGGNASPGVAPTVKPANWKESDATRSLVYHAMGQATTMDKWAHVANNTTNAICYLVFDPILILDEEGNLRPWIAESYEFAKDDTWVKFKLREDVYFTNGVQLTADDLIFTFERLRDDRQHLPDSVVRNWRNYIGVLEKNDKFTVTLNLSQPMPEFWYLIVDPTFQLICKSAYEQMGYDAFWQHPVGTGAYVVESWDAANSICKMTIRTDEHGYWGYKAANTYTNVKNITIQYSPEGQTRLASLRSGEVHVIDNVPTTDKTTLERQGFRTSVLRPKNAVFLQTASAKGDIFDNQKLREVFPSVLTENSLLKLCFPGLLFLPRSPAARAILGIRENKVSSIIRPKQNSW